MANVVEDTSWPHVVPMGDESWTISRPKVQIRSEFEQDRLAVRAVNMSAFDTPSEADLVDTLRQSASPVISLVAEDNGEIVGHILFSPVSLADHPGAVLMGLAPMAVVPGHQRQGVGTHLVLAGLDQCRELGADAVVVLGHPDYYPRFGFVPASRYGITSEYDVPDDVFLVTELRPGSLSGLAGTVKYNEAFGDAWNGRSL